MGTKTPYNQALDLLGARAYSVADLRRKLVQKGADPEEADSVVQRLIEAGLLNDARYAASYARSKLVSSGASARRIVQDLSRKGIRADAASEAIEQVVADEEIDTEAVVRKIAAKKLATMGDLDPLVLRRRLYGFLARRGYDLDEVQRVVRELLPS